MKILINKKWIKKSLVLSFALVLGVLGMQSSLMAKAKSTSLTKDINNYKAIKWENLLPEGFDMESIYARFQDKIASMMDNTAESIDLYKEIQEELNKAPVNKKIHGEMIKLPGYIAPLEVKKDRITQFLLVPYFGQCIHSPPPPINQTVLVDLTQSNSPLLASQGIPVSKAAFPFWVKGTIKVNKQKTDLAEVGYSIEDASFEVYEEN